MWSTLTYITFLFPVLSSSSSEEIWMANLGVDRVAVGTRFRGAVFWFGVVGVEVSVGCSFWWGVARFGFFTFVFFTLGVGLLSLFIGRCTEDVLTCGSSVPVLWAAAELVPLFMEEPDLLRSGRSLSVLLTTGAASGRDSVVSLWATRRESSSS